MNEILIQEFKETKNNFNKIIPKIYSNASIYLNRKFKRAELFIKNNNAVQKSDLLDY